MPNTVNELNVIYLQFHFNRAVDFYNKLAIIVVSVRPKSRHFVYFYELLACG